MLKYRGIRVRRNWTLAQRLEFYSRRAASGCILWTGPCEVKGYGTLFWNGKNRKAHRMAWEAVNGPIPPGLCVCHRCDVPGCVNVEHLFLGTNSENSADRVAKGRQSKGRTHREAHPWTSLTDAQIAEIRAIPKWTKGVAERYGVSNSVIFRARKQKNWELGHDAAALILKDMP